MVIVAATPPLPAAPATAARPLRIGQLPPLWPPLVSAPMAGISCAPYRQLCASYGAQLCTSEMVIASTLLLRNPRSLQNAKLAASDGIRSVQLYGVQPEQLKQATHMLVHELGAQHVDLNFGCPVRKVTARGGGSAVPLRPKLFARLVAASVQGAAGAAPVTVKMRIGLTAELKTHLQAGRIAEAEGVAALTLHSKTADQLYGPPADWDAIGELAAALRIPVVGNGDVYDGEDALRMLRRTGCAGVMIGRAALGRPWVFREVAAALAGRPVPPPPLLGEVARVALEHAHALVAWYSDYESEREALLRMRKLVPLYLHGFGSAAPLRAQLLRADSLQQWRAAVCGGSSDSSACCGGSSDSSAWLYNPAEPFPAAAARHPRLKGGGPPGPRQRMGLPDNWLWADQGDADGDGGAALEAALTDDVCEG